jgi:NAD(P)-dependent dehydrogenase (short-subunit alcohol dehydrogenase family)
MAGVRLDRELPGGWNPPDLSGLVACVTGSSYGVGRGICEVLGQCGATIYLTGRSTRERHTSSAAWTIESTAELVENAGGNAIPVVVDHTVEDDVGRLFARIQDEQGSLGLLVNNVWQWGRPYETYWAPTSEQPIERWDAMFTVGVRGHLLATKHAIPLLAGQAGVIVSTQERPGNDQHFGQNIVVDSAAVAVQRMVRYLARELDDQQITALLVYLGWVRTVNMGMGFDLGQARMSEAELNAMTQSPHFVGRAIAELAADGQVHQMNGRTIYCGDLAVEYGFTDVDGRLPAYDGGEIHDRTEGER